MASDKKSLERERKRLTSIIKQWNESRLDLFSISLPDEKLECHGVMRFYHKDSSNNGKYATKCIRVPSNASTKDVIEMLSTKFRPDMRMLTKPKYVINEVHVDGEMRQLKDKEKPLLVQLSWVKDDREGRFLLHNLNDKTPVRLMDQFAGPNNEDSSFKLTRNLTKKEKKMKKKQEKEKASKKNSSSTEDGSDSRLQEIYTVKHLYSQVPESTFTRTVSNPEAVMKKRREQKLQKRGANILKVYGDRINPEIPYKSLLLLPSDNVTTVIRDALDKYGLGKEQTKDYKLIQVVLPPNSKPEEMLNGGWGMETVMEDPKCPLDIDQNWQPHEGTLVIQLRHIAIDSKNSKRSASPPSSNVSASEKTRDDSDKRNKGKKKTPSPQPEDNTKSSPDSHKNGEVSSEEFPKFLEISTSSDQVIEHAISPNVTEIGSDRRKASYGPFIELRRNDILPTHCVVTNMDGVVTVTPQNRSEVFVDGKPIVETTMLSHGAVVRVGRGKDLVYSEPGGKLSMAQIRKKLQAFAQNRAATQERQQRPTNSQQQPQRMPDKRQKTASLPREMDDQPSYRQTPASSRGPTSSTSSTQSKQSSTAGYNQPHKSNATPQQRQKAYILPATIQLRSGAEETFLVEVVSATGMSLHFKLSPAYAIYLSLRDIAEVTPKPSLEPVLIEYLCTTTDLLDQTIQLNSKVATELAFWMANASELLNFVRHDKDVSPCTTEAQDTLAKTVQLAFRHLVQCMQRELYQLMPAFLSQSDDDLPGGNDSNARNRPNDRPSMYNILHMLSSAMSLLRRCRVNAALTIQLFSQLFHFVNMWIFNEVVTKPEKGLCCRSWGIKLRARLARVEAWAEKQGLELAADCHLARVTQAMHLLQAPKQSAEDIAAISGTCFKLNSLQLRALLSQYIPSERDGETQIPNELIDKVVQVARNTADELTRSDGREVQLEEDPDLQLPFLLPEDGYSCDVVQSVPSGLTEFARPLVAESICAYAVNSEASGSWTVYFFGEEPKQEAAATPGPATPPSHLPPLVLEQPEMATVTFNKHGGGLGLSIVAARGPGQLSMGIYIRSVVKGGAADRDGRLQAGDQLVNVDGHSLVGLTQEEAAGIMTKTGQIVTLTVAKKAALFHGLAPLLEPSPQQERAPVTHRRPGGRHQQQPRPKSDGYALQQQGYQPPNQNTPYANQEKRTQQASNQRPVAHYPNRRKSPINKSTPHLNQEHDHRGRPQPTRSSNQAPRPAMSMGNLQPSENDNSKSRALADWQKTWEAKMAHSTYQRNRAKSSSSTALTSPTSVENRNSKEDDYNRRKQVKSLFTGHVSPRQQQQEHHSPTKSAAQNLSRSRIGSSPEQQQQQHNSMDNPNYEELPPPPTPPPESPLTSKSPDSLTSSRKDSPHDYYASPSPKDHRHDAKLSSPKTSHTMGRHVDTRQPERSKASPIPKMGKSKSSTLPRHFKSAPAWDADAKQRAVQEQLNALRDEEIEELSVRIDSLSTLEKSRLNNLLKERDFQRRVEEESRRIFSDEDISDEGYEVPDRPDRDRLIQLQDDHAEQVDARRDQGEEMRREEERERKRQLEKERREEEERERQLRDRLERERRFEEEERIRKDKEDRRFEEERLRREEERRQYEEERARRDQELKRMEQDRMRREDERIRKEEMERARREEEKRKLEAERIRREKEAQEQQRREWLREERERREREDQERAHQREWEEREQEAERRRNETESKERALREIQMERDARLRALRFENEQKRRRERRMKSSEENEKEEAERERLEKQLSMGKPSSTPKFSRPSAYGAASVFGRHTSTSGSAYPPPTASKPTMRQNVDRGPRPVSDGYFLGKTDHLPDEKDLKTSQNSTSNYNVSAKSPAGSSRPVSYVTSHATPRVIGSQERYRDPRDRREASIKREQSLKRRQQEPSFLTFKDRQRLFSAGQDSPVNKPKASKKLLEIENNLRRSQMS